jgi:hypothetical protein
MWSRSQDGTSDVCSAAKDPAASHAAIVALRPTILRKLNTDRNRSPPQSACQSLPLKALLPLWSGRNAAGKICLRGLLVAAISVLFRGNTKVRAYFNEIHVQTLVSSTVFAKAVALKVLKVYSPALFAR